MDTAKICIAYTGESVNNGTMNINELSAALIALSKLIGHANEILNNDDSTVEVRLSAHIEKGSFEMSFEILRTVAEQIKLFFRDNSHTISEVLGVIGLASTLSGLNLLEFIRWLKCRKIQRVENVSKDTVKIIVDNESKEISIGVWNLYKSNDTHQHIEGIIYPLKTTGIEGVEFRNDDNKEKISTISKDEIEYFSNVENLPLQELKSMQRLMLKIVSVNFERDLKWRFDDGEIKFYAGVKDETFLKAVESGNISFVFGDKIFAEVETIQQIVDGEPRKVIRSIVKVLEYGKNH